MVEAWLASEAARMAVKGLAKKTLKRKLGALVSWHVDLGLSTEGVSNGRVERVIMGANRFHGISTKPQPLPITMPILRKVLREIRRSPLLYGGASQSSALIAVLALGFACFMRLGELTYDTFDPRFDLRRDSVSVVDGQWRLRIEASKGDPMRQGVTVIIPSGPVDVCARTALRSWMGVRGGRPEDPLFSLDGRAMKKAQVVRWLRTALESAGYGGAGFSGHSLRRGAATWASATGMSAMDIKTLGRWNSECYRLYIDAGNERIDDIGKRFMCATTSTLPQSGLPRPGDVWRPAV